MFLTDKKPIKATFRDREAWLKHRTGIGSSEVGSILGINPYQTPYQLWLIKTGQAKPDPMNVYMKAGIYLEEAVATFWEEETKREIIKSSAENIIYIHPEKEYLRVSPDRMFWIPGKRNEQHKGILECKTVRNSFDEISDLWFCQLQYQLGIAQKEYGSLGWLVSGLDFDFKDIDFVPEFFAMIVEQVEKFWFDNVVGGQEPDLINADDILAKFGKHKDNKYIEVGGEIYRTWSNLKQVREELKKLEGQKESLENDLKMAFQDAEGIKYDGKVLATWKAGKDVLKLDIPKFKEAHPEMFNKFANALPGARRLLLK